jgi:glycosyltransferase involved in cell wall biosynthesis
MKILQLISSGGFYGAESVLVNLSVELERLSHQCVVAVFENSANKNTEVGERAKQFGLKVILVPCRGQMDWTAAGRVRNIVEQEGIEITHAHGYKADFYALLARRGTGVPVSATCHNWLGTSFSTRLYGWLDRYLLRFFDGIAAVSKSVADQLTEAGVRQEVRVIPNGVASGFVENLPDSGNAFGQAGQIVVGSVGRLSSEKGTIFFVEAAAKLCREFANVSFVHVGDGPSREVLEAQVRQLGIERQFIFAGQRQDMAQVYRSFDVFVLPSLMEGMPMALLEAMSAGLPIVATTVGSVPSVLNRSDIGHLVPPRDSEALAAAIRPFLEDRAKRESFGAGAKKRVQEHFSASAMARKYVDLYREILIRKGSGMSATSFSANATKDAILRN